MIRQSPDTIHHLLLRRLHNLLYLFQVGIAVSVPLFEVLFGPNIDAFDVTIVVGLNLWFTARWLAWSAGK